MSSKLTSKLTSNFATKLGSAAAATLILVTAGNAQAAQLYATDVVYYNNNNTSMASYRSDTTNALGDPNLTTDSANGYTGNKDFLALGLGGRAVFNFGQDFAGEVSIWETTWGNKSKQSSYDERIDIYYGNFDDVSDWDTLANDLSQWTNAGEVLNIEDNAYNKANGASNAGFAPDGVFNHVLLVDKSQVKSGRDGFDVNAIAVQGVEEQEVPEPTALLGLFMLGTLGTQQLKKRQTA
ncbi:MAG: PEP-CTERM sorting domain-containing protein [Cyanobacteria bacterium J06623_4]